VNIEGADVSTAWLATVDAVHDAGGAAFHVVTRITGDPEGERQEVRALIDDVLRKKGKQPVKTVASTIFPASLAALTNSIEELADRYRADYDKIKKFPGNHDGTYFGRLVAFPAEGGTVDQLSRTVAKLRLQSQPRHHLSSVYECPIAAPAYDAVVVDGAHDTRNMGFPCLSYCSFHLDAEHGAVHLLAFYRNQYLVERGYGNYLGLGRLLAYVAREASLKVGELTVVAGHASIDLPVITQVRNLRTASV
jgi:thymidylate synthase